MPLGHGTGAYYRLFNNIPFKRLVAHVCFKPLVYFADNA